MRHVLSPFLFCLGVFSAAPAFGYITTPVATLGQLSGSTHITVVRVDKVSREKGIIIYRKVRDLKGTYPKDVIRHVFDLKNTPAHKGSGDVPIRPDAKDWQYAVTWAEPGKTALMFTLKYDPYGDFGHTYIDGCWYASMCPPRDWEFWYAIYAETNLLNRWHCGKVDELISAMEIVLAGKTALVPVLVGGTRDDLRAGKGTTQRLRVSRAILDYNPGRDLVPDKASVPSLIKLLQDANKDSRLQACRGLEAIGPDAKAAVPALAEAVRNDASGTVRMHAADALARIGPEAKSALPALEAALKDARLTGRPEVRAKISEVQKKLQGF